MGSVDIPKPMLEVGGRPLMQKPIESLYQMGFGANTITTVIGHGGGVIQAYFRDDMRYVEQTELTGNAGAIDAFLEQSEENLSRDILVIQGDDAEQASVTNLRGLVDLHLSRTADVSILTVNKPDTGSNRIEYVYDVDGRVTGMKLIETTDGSGRYTAGIYIFKEEFLREYLPQLKDSTVPDKEIGIFDLIKLAIKDGKRVFLHLSETPYTAVNSPEGLDRLRNK